MSRDKHDTAKLGVLFVLLLFFGSSVGIGLYFLPSGNQGDVELPNTIVVSSLTPEEEQFLLSVGGTVIYFTYDESCDQCYLLLDKLKESIQGLQPYAYIVYQKGSTTEIYMKNLNGVKYLNAGGLKDIVEYVCSTIPPQTPQFVRCMDLSVVVENETISYG